jgi:hypothetical protein
MSARLVRKQLSSLHTDREEPALKESKGVKKRIQKRRKQLAKELEQQAAKDPKTVYAKNIEYLKATKRAQEDTLEVMAKVIPLQL